MTKKKTVTFCRGCNAQMSFTPFANQRFCSDECRLVDLSTRFNRYVVKRAGCWSWSGSIGGHGYGQIQFNRLPMPAHRASWIIHNGPIPNGMLVCHRCDNTECSNPEHLFLGTHQENMADMANKKRATNYKLTADQAREIRALVNSGESLRSVAQRFSIKAPTVAQIRDRITFKNVV